MHLPFLLLRGKGGKVFLHVRKICVQLFRALTHYGAEHFVLIRKAAVQHPRRNARAFRDRAHGSVRKALFHELRLGALQKF